MSKKAFTVGEIAAALPDLITELHGNKNAEVFAVDSPESAKLGSLVFCLKSRALVSAEASQATALVLPPKLMTELKPNTEKSILVSHQPELLMSKLIQRFFFQSPYRNPNITGIHPTAVVADDAILASSCRVGPHAVIGAGVKVGSQTYIGANAVIEEGTSIGCDCTIHPLTYIGHHSIIGDRVEVLPSTVVGKEGFGYSHDKIGNHFRIPHQGKVVLEDDVHVGASCTIDRGTFGETRIKQGTKIDNQVHIGHNCTIGRNSLITAGFLMAGSSSVGDFFVTGGRTSVTGHVHVTDQVQIGGHSGISKDITKSGSYAGSPLLPLQQHLRVKAALAQLPELRKQVAKLMKKVYPHEEN